MSKKIEFKVPCRGNEQVVKTGRVTRLNIGNRRRIRFVIQDDGILAHYATGRVIGKIGEAKVEHMCTYGHHARMTDYAAARAVMEKQIAKHGAEKILNQLDSFEVINE